MLRRATTSSVEVVMIGISINSSTFLVNSSVVAPVRRTLLGPKTPCEMPSPTSPFQGKIHEYCIDSIVYKLDKRKQTPASFLIMVC